MPAQLCRNARNRGIKSQRVLLAIVAAGTAIAIIGAGLHLWFDTMPTRVTGGQVVNAKPGAVQVYLPVFRLPLQL
jgi:hypothetical protein